jgi:hypothetical protein
MLQTASECGNCIVRWHMHKIVAHAYACVKCNRIWQCNVPCQMQMTSTIAIAVGKLCGGGDFERGRPITLLYQFFDIVKAILNDIFYDVANSIA